MIEGGYLGRRQFPTELLDLLLLLDQELLDGDQGLLQLAYCGGQGGGYNVVSRHDNFVLMPQNPTFFFPNVITRAEWD